MGGLSRREFVFLGSAAGAAIATGVVLPLTRLSESPVGPGAAVAEFFPYRRVAALSGLKVGEPVLFDYPQEGQASMLDRLGNSVETGVGPANDVVAFSRICTHMGCVIDDYRADHATLGPCPCHFSTFDFSTGGQVILGQATSNLPQVLLRVDGDDIVATGVVRLVYGYESTLSTGTIGASA